MGVSSTNRRAGARPREVGFTLIELLIVVAIVGILAGIAIPAYQHALKKSREAVLAEDLWTMRDLIQQYYVDKGQYPADLEELVGSHYLKAVPRDPFTHEAEWEEVPAEPTEFDDPLEQAGIVDVKSLAPGTGTNGVPYTEW